MGMVSTDLTKTLHSMVIRMVPIGLPREEIYYYRDLTPGVKTYQISGKKINIVENSLQ